jgi:hypothetical protein
MVLFPCSKCCASCPPGLSLSLNVSGSVGLYGYSGDQHNGCQSLWPDAGWPRLVGYSSTPQEGRCVGLSSVTFGEKSGADVLGARLIISFPGIVGQNAPSGSVVRFSIVQSIAGWETEYEVPFSGYPTCENGVQYTFGPSNKVSGNGSFCGGSISWIVAAPCFGCCCTTGGYTSRNYTKATCEAAGHIWFNTLSSYCVNGQPYCQNLFP